MQRNRQGRDLPSLPPFIAVLNQEIFLGSKDYSEETLIFSMKETLLWRRLHFMFLLVTSGMEKLHYTWQQRMVAVKLHGCFLLMVLLLKPKRMSALLNGMTPLHLAVWYSISGRSLNC
ncbi:AAA-type ATPase family protein / ankyrin repeat family protein [Salix suchowensis]|nr:AAA-type ATPase family protein / ankyrin repeat family protein [Salix suchowensis]